MVLNDNYPCHLVGENTDVRWPKSHPDNSRNQFVLESCQRIVVKSNRLPISPGNSQRIGICQARSLESSHLITQIMKLQIRNHERAGVV